jgi:6-phosphogluconolactonase (cycloisomerase 2 family)
LALMATAVVVAALPATALAKKVVGRVYTETNGKLANRVVVFNRYMDGTLHQIQVVKTGGKGGLQPQPGCTPPGGCPILDTQGEVVLSPNGKWLLAVNAGSNTVSSFRVTPFGLKLVDVTNSGGVFPNSLTMHGNLAYVLNSNSHNIAGAHIAANGHILPISGSVRPLVGQVVPGLARQIGFDNTGHVLVVTLLGDPTAMPPSPSNTIDTFRVHPNGSASAGTAHNATSAFPFGFAFDPVRDHLVVSQINSLAGAPVGDAASYNVSQFGGMAPLSTAGTHGFAPCWVAINGGGSRAYVVNTGGGAPSGSTVSTFGLASNGHLSLLGVNTQTSSEFAKTDEVLSSDSHYLYVLAPGVMGNTSHIDIYKTSAFGGGLALIGETPAVGPAGMSGLAGT